MTSIEKKWVRKALEERSSTVAIARASRVHVSRVRRALDKAGLVNEGSRRYPKWVAKKAKAKGKNGAKKKKNGMRLRKSSSSSWNGVPLSKSVPKEVIVYVYDGKLVAEEFEVKRFINLALEGRAPEAYRRVPYNVSVKLG